MKAKGFLFGIATGLIGYYVLKSREAKNVYAHIGAAVLHGKDDIMKQGQILKENIQDITARAKDINEAVHASEKENMIKNVYEKQEEAAAAEAEAEVEE